MDMKSSTFVFYYLIGLAHTTFFTCSEAMGMIFTPGLAPIYARIYQNIIRWSNRFDFIAFHVLYWGYLFFDDDIAEFFGFSNQDGELRAKVVVICSVAYFIFINKINFFQVFHIWCLKNKLQATRFIKKVTKRSDFLVLMAIILIAFYLIGMYVKDLAALKLVTELIINETGLENDALANLNLDQKTLVTIMCCIEFIDTMWLLFLVLSFCMIFYYSFRGFHSFGAKNCPLNQVIGFISIIQSVQFFFFLVSGLYPLGDTLTADENVAIGLILVSIFVLPSYFYAILFKIYRMNQAKLIRYHLRITLSPSA